MTGSKALVFAASALLTIGIGGTLPAAADSPTTFVAGNAQPWVGTGIQVDDGDLITASGAAITTLDYVRYGSVSGPDGQPIDCSTQLGSACLVPGAPYGALIGKVGATVFVIGADYTVAGLTGELELAVNDNLAYYEDNRGGYATHVRRR